MKGKKIFKSVLKILGGIVAFITIYGLCVLLLPMIEVPAEKTNEPKNIPIYIYTNGVHTDLVLPVKNEFADWSQFVPFDNTKSKQTGFQYIGIGWGDKGFYLDTPTWADLKFSTAFKAAFWLSESAMHCTYYNQMKEAEDCKKIMVSAKEYQNLCSFVKNKFDTENGKTLLIKTNAVYGNNDAFYDAKGRYSFLETCNTWTNNGLKSAGQKAALWTATDKGIFRHY